MSAALFQPEATAKAPLRRPLLSSCAIAAALIAGSHSAQVRAQAFQASTPVQLLGSVVQTITSPTTETITINTDRSEEHTSELQSLLRNSYAVFCLKKKK